MSVFPGDTHGVRYFVSDVIDCSTVHDQSWGSDWPILGAGVAPLTVGARAQIVNVSGTHAANPAFKFGTNAAFDNINSGTLAAFGSLNTMVATGGTKNFSLNLAMTPNNTALTGLDAIPTVSVTTACSVGAALSVRIVIAMTFGVMA